jgi:hypothetical protein
MANVLATTTFNTTTTTFIVCRQQLLADDDAPRWFPFHLSAGVCHKEAVFYFP